MNTIPVQTAQSANSPSAAVSVSDNTTTSAKPSIAQASLKLDHYSATAANDAVVAKVISSSINRSFGNTPFTNEIAESSSARLSEKFTSQESEEVSAAPNFETVTANVVSFVESALANLAKRGFDKEQLTFFRNEAVTGVEVGIDQAKLELVGIASNDLFTTIDKTKESIIGGINQLSVEPFEYEHTIKNIEKVETGTQRELAAIEVTTFDKDLAKIDFETRAFNAVKIEANRSLFTTSSSNISFSVQGDLTERSRHDLANFINKVDGLANSFYRGDIESAYNKSKDLGYSDNEIIGLAKQLHKSDTSLQMKTYGDIQHLNVDSDKTDFTAPKTVAEYVNRYLDVMESGNTTLNAEKDFNQVLNGLVNQMKDVQVPDLLQAINRFHAFNKRFS
jgi:hypothetical protein